MKTTSIKAGIRTQNKYSRMNLIKEIRKASLLISIAACMVLAGCVGKGVADDPAIVETDFSKIGDYKVRIPTMQIVELHEHYKGVADETTSYHNFLFNKNTGLLTSMDIKGEDNGRSEFGYDVDGRLTSARNGKHEVIISYNDDGLPDSLKYKMDKNGYVKKAYVSDGTVARKFNYHESSLIESFSEKARPSYSDEIRKDDFKVKYDIYGDIISIEGKELSREYTYKAKFVKSYAAEDKEELNPSSKWEAFNECRIIPTPDSCINTIKKDDPSNGREYVYLLPGKSELQLKNQITISLFDYCFGAYCPKPKGSDEIYFEYLSILKDVCGIELSVNDDGNTLMSDSDGNRLGILCYKQVSGKGSCLEIRFI